jgi:hypothetical protein
MARTKQTAYRGNGLGHQGVTTTHKQVAKKERKKKLSRAEAEERLKNNPDDQQAFEAIVTLAGAGRKKQQGQKYWRELLAKEPHNQEAQTQLQKLVADAARKKQADHAKNPQRMAGKERVTKKQTDAAKVIRHEKAMEELAPLLTKGKRTKKEKEKVPVLPATEEEVLKDFLDRPESQQYAIGNKRTGQMINVKPSQFRSQVFQQMGTKQLISDPDHAKEEYDHFKQFIHKHTWAGLSGKPYEKKH